MPCACQTRKDDNTENKDLPHNVKPGQSCIFCAYKHVSTAYTAISNNDYSAAIGDLELARRHTLLEYPEVCTKICYVEYNICTRNKIDNIFTPVLEILDKYINKATSMKEDETEPDDAGVLFQFPVRQANNPFVGEIHICAAYRLAFEIGYMLQNKAMIIGDMEFAAEHLVHHFYEVVENIRERRHYIQTTRASDINMYWPYLTNKVKEHIDHNLTAYTAEYADGLAKWLGVLPDNK